MEEIMLPAIHLAELSTLSTRAFNAFSSLSRAHSALHYEDSAIVPFDQGHTDGLRASAHNRTSLESIFQYAGRIERNLFNEKTIAARHRPCGQSTHFRHAIGRPRHRTLFPVPESVWRQNTSYCVRYAVARQRQRFAVWRSASRSHSF